MSSRVVTNVVKSRKAIGDEALKEKKVKRESSLDRSNIKVNATTRSKLPSTRTAVKAAVSRTSSVDSKSSLSSQRLSVAKPVASTTRPTAKKVDTSSNSKKVDTNSTTKKVNTSSTSKKVDTSSSSKKVDTGNTSSRIQTSQYYPNKQLLYKNALKSEGIIVSKPSTKPASKVATSSNKTTKVDAKPKVRKVLKDSGNSSDTSASITSDRPGTATLTKGLIVNTNIAGPDAPKVRKGSIILPNEDTKAVVTQISPRIEDVPPADEVEILEAPSEQQSKSPTGEDDYEDDDFDSYASDFDEYHSSSQASTTSSGAANLPTEDAITSSSSSEELHTPTDSTKRVSSADEERKLDSGNFDMPENKHKQLLDNIREDNEQNSLKVRVNAMSSLSDEGFEDGKVVRSTSVTFIDFSKVKLQIQKRKSLERGKTRGEEILEMIKLDVQSFVVLDMLPISYEDFIKSFGNRKSCQVSCQTGDDSHTEETQTDDIESCEKWTQCPIKFSKISNSDDNYLQIYKSDLLGVGCANSDQENLKPSFSEVRLTEFMKNTSNLLFTLFEEATKYSAKNIEVNTNNVPFSSGFVTLNTKYKQFLIGRIISNIAFSTKTNSRLLSVHKKYDSKSSADFRCLICVWDINKTDEPQHVLSSFGDINCCCFHIENCSLIIAGLSDGTITMWNTSTNNVQKSIVVLNGIDIILPIYTSEIDSKISSPVIFIQTSCEVIDLSNTAYEGNSIQIYTINEDSILRIWGILKVAEGNHNWTYTLVENQKIFLSDIYPELKDMQCLTATMSHLDPNHLFISTNYGYIIHCLTTKTKANPKKFAKVVDDVGVVTSLTPCPYAPFHFLAATSLGSTVIYSRTLARPLMTFKHLVDATELRSVDSGKFARCQVQWSFTRPCRFYTLAPQGRTIQCWNLAYSDMVPENSVHMDETINCIKLSPIGLDKNGKNIGRCFMAISTESNIFLHVLNEGHGHQSIINYHNDIRMFMNYIISEHICNKNTYLSLWQQLHQNVKMLNSYSQNVMFKIIICNEVCTMDDHVKSYQTSHLLQLQSFYQQFLFIFYSVYKNKRQGVEPKHLVKFINRHYNLDGDIAEQVHTALKQALDQGLIRQCGATYHLVGPIASVQNTAPNSPERRMEFDLTYGIFNFISSERKSKSGSESRSRNSRSTIGRRKSLKSAKTSTLSKIAKFFAGTSCDCSMKASTTKLPLSSKRSQSKSGVHLADAASRRLVQRQRSGSECRNLQGDKLKSCEFRKNNLSTPRSSKSINVKSNVKTARSINVTPTSLLATRSKTPSRFSPSPIKRANSAISNYSTASNMSAINCVQNPHQIRQTYSRLSNAAQSRNNIVGNIRSRTKTCTRSKANVSKRSAQKLKRLRSKNKRSSSYKMTTRSSTKGRNFTKVRKSARLSKSNRKSNSVRRLPSKRRSSRGSCLCCSRCKL